MSNTARTNAMWIGVLMSIPILGSPRGCAEDPQHSSDFGISPSVATDPQAMSPIAQIESPSIPHSWEGRVDKLGNTLQHPRLTTHDMGFVQNDAPFSSPVPEGALSQLEICRIIYDGPGRPLDTPQVKCRNALHQVLGLELRVMIEASETHRYPQSLNSLFDHRGDHLCHDLPDAWGQPYSYNLLPSGFELFSNGPDRLPYTDDDIDAGTLNICDLPPDNPINIVQIAATRDYGGIHADKCMIVWDRLEGLGSYVRSFYKDTGGYPEHLGEVFLGGNIRKFRRLVDPWAEPYEYHRVPSGFELYSKGVDRLSNTDDDLKLGFDKQVCRTPPYGYSTGVTK